jgi:two-component system sensor histidine kinase RegB
MWITIPTFPHREPFESRLRLQTIVRLRWFAVLGQLITVAIVQYVLDFVLPLSLCLIVITLSAWLNVFLSVRFPARYRLGAGFATLLLCYDILQLAALLYLTGGIANPFSVLLVAPVTVSAATLPARNTLLLGLVGALAAIVLTFYYHPLPWFAASAFAPPLLYKLGMLAAVIACMVFQALYALRLSREGRQMSAALAATEQVLAREQQLHALDGLAAAAAHELGTPLATIALVTKELERDFPPSSPHGEDIALLRAQALRCREILQKLTRRPSEPDPMHASVSITQLLDEAAAAYRTPSIRFAIDAAPTAGAEGAGAAEPIAERRPGVIFGIANLIENSADFAASEVLITARWNEREVVVTIADDGPGFAPGVMDALGEPYVTQRTGLSGKRAGGLGLGFFIAQTLLERSGATIALSNRSGGGNGPATGAVVTITWRREAIERTPPPAGSAPGFKLAGTGLQGRA